jgi:two-component system, cell cycle response regulator
MRILIADDDPVSRRLLEATLCRAGHEVTSVTNGLEAIRVSGLPDSPRMAIIDWMMPGADGLAVCRAIRQRPGPYTYLMMITARDRQEDMIAGLAAQADDFLRKPFDPVELLARLQSGQRVLALQERLLESQAELHHQAMHDRLTGLPNRAMALDYLMRELERAKRGRQPLAAAMADIDHFKRINDTYGHPAGDAVLQEAATRMSAVRRPYDLIARYGGEEFLLLLPGCDLVSGVTVAERVHHAVAARPISINTLSLRLTVSVGVSCTSDVGDDPAVLIEAADKALYRAKSLGRDRVER